MTKSFLNSISLRTISRSSYLPQAKPPLSHAIYVNPDKLKAFPFKSLVKIKFGHNKNSTCRIYEEKVWVFALIGEINITQLGHGHA